MRYPLKPKYFVAPSIGGGLGWILSGNFAVGVALFAVLLFPVFVSIHLRYAKDNPQHLWFKRKLYGWGWTPVTWQGWLVTFLYVVLVVACALTIDDNSPPQEIMFTFVLPVTLLTITLMRIAYKKGEKPRWQWGDDHK